MIKILYLSYVAFICVYKHLVLHSIHCVSCPSIMCHLVCTGDDMS